MRIANLPTEPQTVSVTNRYQARKTGRRVLFRKAGEVAGTRRHIEIIKWMNYVTDGRFVTLAADLSSPSTWSTAVCGVTMILRPIRPARA